MAYEKLVAFGAGETTPQLSERDNIAKNKTGLKTLRNAQVNKFGGLRSRYGTVYSNILNIPGDEATYWTLKNKPWLFELKTDRFMVHGYTGNYTFELHEFFPGVFWQDYPGSFTYTIKDLKNLHFSEDEDYLYVYCEGKNILRISLELPFMTPSLITNFTPPAFIYGGGQAVMTVNSTGFTAPTGYNVDYGYTQIIDDVESFIVVSVTGAKLPQATNEANNVYVNFSKTGAPPNFTSDELPDRVNFYRRPKDSGAWGFVGEALPVVISTSITQFKILDVGQDADLTNQPPDFVSGFRKAGEIKPKTGIIYQNRQIVAVKNQAFGTRTDATDVMTRDFPLQDDSAVAFKTGSDGGSTIGRFYDYRGLLITTSVGLFETPSDLLKPDTAFAIKRSNVKHDPILPVVGMGSSVFVTDQKLKGIFKLVPSQNGVDLNTIEVSIFSSHLFKKNKIVSWDIEEAETQTLWVVRDDGVLLSFSYQEDQDLQGWARHDTRFGKFKQVMTLKIENGADVVLFVTERTNADGDVYRQIELLADNTTTDVQNYTGTDCTTIYKNQFVKSGHWLEFTNDDPVPTLNNGRIEYKYNVDRTVTDYNDLNLIPDYELYDNMVVTLDNGILAPIDYIATKSPFSNTGYVFKPYGGIFADIDGEGAVGSIFRFFNPDTKEPCDYEVTNYIDGFNVDVQLVGDRDIYQVMDVEPDLTITLTEMYQTFTLLTQLPHGLIGRQVSVRLDGFTHASPLNTDKGYNIYTVSGGREVNLDERGAIIHVGIPIVTDIQTYSPESTEQVSDKLVGVIANKAYVSYYESRGLYLGSDLPKDDTITGMVEHESFYEPEEGIEPYKPYDFYSRREQVEMVGDWSASSSIAARNVDPQPISLRGFILDLEVLGE